VTRVAALYDLTGKVVVGIRRMLYVHKGSIKGSAGPLELTFSDGTSTVFDAGADGESLTVVGGVWIDPFEGPLTEENRTFVETSGRWTPFNMEARVPYSRMIGSRVDQVEAVETPSGKVVGARLRMGDLVLLVTVDSDELLVDVA
jgi:hypothetical protein